MSQVGVTPRPVSQGGQPRLATNLPEIPHPLSRLGDPDKLNIRGLSSRQGERPTSNPPAPRAVGEIPFNLTPPRLSRSAAGRDQRESGLRHTLPKIPTPFSPAIPEGIEVVRSADPSKPRIPIFGSRADLASRPASRPDSRGSIVSLSRPDTRFRTDLEELENLLREKVRRGYYELRKLFVSNDPEQRGVVSRDALHRIITTFLGKYISSKHFNHLLTRLKLGEKQAIRLDEFYASFREVVSTEMPSWMDPVNRQMDKVTMTSSQVHVQLKEKARQRFLDMAALIPQMNPGGTGRILKPEFRNMLGKLQFFLDEDEFDKLWKKYDPEDIGVISGDRLLNRLGINFRADTAHSSLRKRHEPSSPRSPKDGEKSPRRSPKKAEIERQKSLDMERWLKKKFREGFSNLRSKFEKYDPEKTGEVDVESFIKVMARFGLKLDQSQLENFAARCSLEFKGEKLSYKDFLTRFQDRSDSGMPHKILLNAQHRYNKTERASSPHTMVSLTAIEAKLMSMFQDDFLTLLGVFHNIDKSNKDRVGQEEFRAAIESRFGKEMTDDEFQRFMNNVPLDDEGLVDYPAFMSQFDTRGVAPSIFDEKSIAPSQGLAPKAAPSIANRPVSVPVDYTQPMDIEEFSRGRSTGEMHRLVKNLVKTRYQEVEQTFYDLDETNSKRLTHEMMYQLLKKFEFKPEVTRSEVRKLWDTFIVTEKGMLEYSEFVRHFIYDRKTASFPNAKVSPPKRGDADFRLRSRKLQCDLDMLEDSLRSKIDYMWDDLRREFLQLDKKGIGFVPRKEFKDILQELCVQLNEYELGMICDRFDTKRDGSISYIEFLKPFALRRQAHRFGNNMSLVMNHPQAELAIDPIVDSPVKGLGGLTAKLRHKLVGDWRNLRRAFKKLDTDHTGYLSTPEFRSVLKLCNVILDEEEVYHVLSQFDEDLNGKINYEKFLSGTFRPNPLEETIV